ncbi:MAG: ABC transporter permease [Candidatus Heimdallarchaeota archaeon]|nr:ABC transporter permease [Candidatus Heimdallarchaeota archaeon]
MALCKGGKNEMISEIFGECIKTLRSWKRNPILIFIGFISPLLFTTIFIQSFTISEDLSWEVVVVNQDEPIISGSWTEKLIISLESREGTIPYFSVIIYDLDAAEMMLQNRETFVIVIIPDGFTYNISNNEPIVIQVKINNIHEDLSKNLRLGLEARIYQFIQNNQLSTGDRPGYMIHSTLLYTEELARSNYMVSGLLVFITIFVSMLYGGILGSEEKDKNTWKEILMVNNGSSFSILGKLLATLMITSIYVLIILIISMIFYNFSFPNFESIIVFGTISLGLTVLFGLLGVLYGFKVGDFRLIPAPTIIFTFLMWFISGALNPLEFMANSEIFKFSPTASATRIFTATFFGRGTQYLIEAYGIFFFWMILIVLPFCIWVVKIWKDSKINVNRDSQKITS